MCPWFASAIEVVHYLWCLRGSVRVRGGEVCPCDAAAGGSFCPPTEGCAGSGEVCWGRLKWTMYKEGTMRAVLWKCDHLSFLILVEKILGRELGPATSRIKNAISWRHHRELVIFNVFILFKLSADTLIKCKSKRLNLRYKLLQGGNEFATMYQKCQHVCLARLNTNPSAN